MSTAEEEPIGVARFAGAQRDVERLLQENVTSWSIVNAVWQRFNAAQGTDAARLPLEADQLPVDQGPQVSREDLLADQLSREYDYRSITELEQEDPERAQEHRAAARNLGNWIEECPKEERRAAFGRGFDRGKERQKVRTAADIRRLEAEVAELRQERDPEGLRARIRDLEYALAGWDRFMTGRTRAGAAPDWQAQAAEYLAKLTQAQRELAVLKGVQPSNATGERPS